ncbi:hypothetical protein DPMN_131904 [Dreissena polymorpha]|uniref:Uncharacterized protein n=1 Tax=Dreissena polymorpha TaxID=45954 RepID=A0A9D4FUW0_DREPO|nr:hypothetical protein DPMN_131904 [Dreissena polymorpha]
MNRWLLAVLSVDGLPKTTNPLHHGINTDKHGQTRQQHGINTEPARTIPAEQRGITDQHGNATGSPG